MAHDDINHTDLDSLEDESGSLSQIPPVSRKKPFPMPLLIGGLVILLLLSAMAITNSNKKPKEESGVNFTGEEFSVRNNPAPFQVTKADLPKPDLQAPLPAPQIAGQPDGTAHTATTAEEKQKQRQEEDLQQRRRHSPVVMVNKSQGQDASGRKDISDPELHNLAKEKMDRLEQRTQEAINQMNDSNTAPKEEGFLKTIHSENVEQVQATVMEDRSYKVAQGKMIPGVLETAINSDLPGMIRAIVSESVYSEDGNALLVPKGSRLVGQYRSGLQRGQTRIFVIWSRLIRPDGIDIKLDSPGTDQLGGAGLTGEVDSHFMERFGASALLSLIGGYAQQGTSNDRQVVALSESFDKSSEIALQNSINIPPTVHVNQGEPIDIFVAKDLDFRQALVYKQRQLKGF